MAVVVEHAVVDADFVDVAAAHEVVVALDVVRADDARVRAELVEGGVVDGRRLVLRGEFAVHVKADAARLVPRQGEVRPLVGLWETAAP